MIERETSQWVCINSLTSINDVQIPQQVLIPKSIESSLNTILLILKLFFHHFVGRIVFFIKQAALDLFTRCMGRLSRSLIDTIKIRNYKLLNKYIGYEIFKIFRKL